MFQAKGYGKKRIILATPKTAVKADTKVSEKKVLEEPTPVKEDKKILVEAVEEKVEEPVIETVEETKVEEKPKKKTSKKKAE